MATAGSCDEVPPAMKLRKQRERKQEETERKDGEKE
jgi:hypothetical protein